MRLLVCALVALAVTAHAEEFDFEFKPRQNMWQEFMGDDSFNHITGWNMHDMIRHASQKLLGTGFDWLEAFKTKEMKLADVFTSLRGAQSDSVPETVRRIREVVDEARRRYNMPRKEGFTPLGNLTYPYFGFLPYVHGSAIPDGATVQWAGACFKNNTLTTHTVVPGKHYKLVFTASEQTGLFCSDVYAFMTVEGASWHSVDKSGVQTFDWIVPADATAAEQWDVTTKGFRVFRFDGDIIELILDLIDTVMIFIPETTQGVGQEAAEYNLDFLSKYANVHMKPRATNVIHLDISDIHSGDFFGIIRLDGLDPMLAWAMGSTTGHTTVALEIDGSMHICESTAKDSYWPVNGIQCTPYAQWVDMANAAGYNVVHAPLSEEYRAKFDVDKAVTFVKSVLGLDYGYHNMLWGWIDTVKDNYPCTAPDFSSKCLTWDLVEVMFGIVDRLVPSIGDLMWNQAWSKRVGKEDLRTADIYYEAWKQGIVADTIPVIVEEDSWLYNTTRYNATNHVMGKSMVCCVFVCNTWKAAGIFESINNELNCAELTNWDDYSLQIFDPHYDQRPKVCRDADPDNKNCQIVGNYTVMLNNYNSKPFYPHIAEKCPSLAPNYEKPANC